MIDNKIDVLFKTIKESQEYQEYLKINNIIKNNPEIITLIEEIKKLNKQATMKEYQKDSDYQKIDKVIQEKIKILNSNPLYVEYKNKMDNLNDILAVSSNMLQKYIDDVV